MNGNVNPPIAYNIEPIIGPNMYPKAENASAKATFCSCSSGWRSGMKE